MVVVVVVVIDWFQRLIRVKRIKIIYWSMAS